MGIQPGVEEPSQGDQEQPCSAWESADTMDSRVWWEGETQQVFTETRENQTGRNLFSMRAFRQ